MSQAKSKAVNVKIDNNILISFDKSCDRFGMERCSTIRALMEAFNRATKETEKSGDVIMFPIGLRTARIVPTKEKGQPD